jgi:hypothetical protein
MTQERQHGKPDVCPIGQTTSKQTSSDKLPKSGNNRKNLISTSMISCQVQLLSKEKEKILVIGTNIKTGKRQRENREYRVASQQPPSESCLCKTVNSKIKTTFLSLAGM